MFYIIEPICKKWEHENVNKSLIELIRQCFPEEKVKIFADETHISSIRTQKQNLDYQSICLPEDIDDNFASVFKYAQLFKQIFKESKITREDKVLFLSSSRGIILALMLIMWRHPFTKCFLVCHSYVEDLIIKSKDQSKGRCIVLKILLECSCRMCGFDYIIFSPHARQKVQKIFSRVVNKHFNYIYMPFTEKYITKKMDSEKINLLLWGACVNNDSINIIKHMNEDPRITSNYNFSILARNTTEKLSGENIEHIINKSGIDDDQIKKHLEKSDLIFLPYDDKKYNLCMSAIWCDAVNYGVPIITLDNAMNRYYFKKYKIGCVVKHYADIKEALIQISLDRSELKYYEEEEKKLKRMMLYENKKLIIKTLNKR